MGMNCARARRAARVNIAVASVPTRDLLREPLAAAEFARANATPEAVLHAALPAVSAA